MTGIKKTLVWFARLRGMKCKTCGKRMADYNKLCRWLDTDVVWKRFHRKDGDGICYICMNSTCAEYQMVEFIKD